MAESWHWFRGRGKQFLSSLSPFRYVSLPNRKGETFPTFPLNGKIFLMLVKENRKCFLFRKTNWLLPRAVIIRLKCPPFSHFLSLSLFLIFYFLLHPFSSLSFPTVVFFYSNLFILYLSFPFLSFITFLNKFLFFSFFFYCLMRVNLFCSFPRCHWLVLKSWL